VGTGNANTVAMDTACTSGAGQSAADYTNNGYSDWYLPSLNELTEMFDRRVAIGGFTTASYWSSSEENGEFAKRLGFPDGGMSGHVKSQGFRVRPIRAFAPLTDCQLGLSCAVGDIGPAGGRIIYVNPNESNEYDYVVCGHIHQPEMKEIKNDKGSIMYLNSGDWIENLTALEFNEGKWSIYKYNDDEVAKSIDLKKSKDHKQKSNQLFEELVNEFNLMKRA
jgi:hypothetical protein